MDTKKISLPPLHLKLGSAKIFTKSMGHTGNVFQYLCYKLGRVVSEAELKAAVLNDPHIRMLVHDNEFPKTLNPLDSNAWK